MIALGIRYLTKYAVATDLARQLPEWPPHPGRVFMAMVAAHFETEADPEERRALEWLEETLPPALRASDADDRTSTRAYVPVNDVHGGIIRRPRQDRAFPRTRPHDDCVYLIWAAEPTVEARAALARLCAKVTRVGHSMSAVQMWVAPAGQEPEPNWLPGTMRQHVRLRVPEAGTLRSLEVAFNGKAIQEYDLLAESLATATGRQKARLKNELQMKFPDGPPEPKRPQLGRWQGYSRPTAGADDQPVFDGPFDENFVVLSKTEGPTLGLESTLQLTGALRNGALKAAGLEVPEWLSGHDARRTRRAYIHTWRSSHYPMSVSNLPMAMSWAWVWPFPGISDSPARLWTRSCGAFWGRCSSTRTPARNARLGFGERTYGDGRLGARSANGLHSRCSG